MAEIPENAEQLLTAQSIGQWCQFVAWRHSHGLPLDQQNRMGVSLIATQTETKRLLGSTSENTNATHVGDAATETTPTASDAACPAVWYTASTGRGGNTSKTSSHGSKHRTKHLCAMLAKNPCEDVFDVFCPLVRKCHDDCGLAFLLFPAWCEEQTEVCFLRVIALVQFLDPQFCWREVLYLSDFLIAVPSSTTPTGLPRLGVPSHLDVCLFTQTVPLGDTTIFDTHTLLGKRSPRPTKPQGIHSFSSLCYTTLVPLDPRPAPTTRDLIDANSVPSSLSYYYT